MDEPTTTGGVTRRSLLQTGGGAMLVALIGSGPLSVAKAFAGQDAPAHLRRSSYLPLVGTAFMAGSRTLRLDQVTGEREDVFGLTFMGAQLDQGIHELRHPQLGTFSLFVAPVGAATDHQAVIDRSVKLPEAQAAVAASAPAPPAQPQPQPAAARSQDPALKHRPLLRHARLRGAGHGLRCEVVLSHTVKRVDVHLLRGARTVAKGHRKLRGTHVAVRLDTRHRLPAGDYRLLVVTIDLKGRVTSQVTIVRIP